MPTAKSQFETAKASQYLQQLCKHFAHKTEAVYDEHKGHVTFGMGVARMAADETALSFEAEAASAEALDRVKRIIENHIVRFAFRENLEKLTWA